jgi:hypothetical protein
MQRQPPYRCGTGKRSADALHPGWPERSARVANYPKTGQAVATYTGEWPDTQEAAPANQDHRAARDNASETALTPLSNQALAHSSPHSAP